jgi:hypothetical protein
MMETCTRMALGDGAINGAKDEVEAALETRKILWGLMYDTEKTPGPYHPKNWRRRLACFTFRSLTMGTQRSRSS